MKRSLLLAGAMCLAVGAAAQLHQPAPSIAPDVANDHFERLRNLRTELQGQWVKQKSTIEGMPGVASVSVWDAGAPSAAVREFRKGNKALAAGDAHQAIEHYEEALKQYPSYLSAYNNIGAAALLAGDNARAKQALLQAVKLDPKQPMPLANLCRVALNEREFGTAEEYMKRAVALAPDAEHLTLLVLAETLNFHYDAALADGHKVHAGKHAGRGIVHFIMAVAYDEQNKRAEAISEYKQFLKEDPRNPRAPMARQQLVNLGAK